MAGASAKGSDVRLGKIVGENEDGLTLFVPKDMHGTFKLTEGDQFLSLLFVRNTGDGNLAAWVPWED